jgi:hypothetical protein
MRTGITVEVSAANRRELAAIAADRNSPQKHAWRAQTVPLTAEGCGTAEIMRRADASKTTVWRWQERCMLEGVVDLLRDKTRPLRTPPLTAGVEADVVSRTLAEPTGETTRWTAPAMAKVTGISVNPEFAQWSRESGGSPEYRLSRRGVDSDDHMLWADGDRERRGL